MLSMKFMSMLFEFFFGSKNNVLEYLKYEEMKKLKDEAFLQNGVIINAAC